MVSIRTPALSPTNPKLDLVERGWIDVTPTQFILATMEVNAVSRRRMTFFNTETEDDNRTSNSTYMYP